MKKLYGMNEVAQMLGMAYHTIWNATLRRKVAPRRIACHYAFTQQDIEALRAYLERPCDRRTKAYRNCKKDEE